MPDSLASLVVVVTGAASQLLGKRFVLERLLRVGRDPRCEIHADLPALLPHHATVKRFGSTAFEVEAAHPDADILVNHVPVAFKVIAPGDTLTFGPLSLKLIGGSNSEAAYHEELYRLTICDPLTGVFNKRYVVDALQREMLRAARYGRPLSLVTFRIERLEASGRAADEVIRHVALQIQREYAREAVVARTADTVFAVVVPDTDVEVARKAAASIAENAGVRLGWTAMRVEPGELDIETVL